MNTLCYKLLCLYSDQYTHLHALNTIIYMQSIYPLHAINIIIYMQSIYPSTCNQCTHYMQSIYPSTCISSGMRSGWQILLSWRRKIGERLLHETAVMSPSSKCNEERLKFKPFWKKCVNLPNWLWLSLHRTDI